jgi:hypothetical protein
MRLSRLAQLVSVIALIESLSLVVVQAQEGCGSARTCTEQYRICVSTCIKYGLGTRRMSQPKPQPPQICQQHCIGWKTDCMTTGCWKGDLCQACGLAKQ